jgi:hypothetical protein
MIIGITSCLEGFVGNILEKRPKSYEIELQKPEHLGKTDKSLRIYIDIMIIYQGLPILILDTKYQAIHDKPQESHLAQLCLYSNTTR